MHLLLLIVSTLWLIDLAWHWLEAACYPRLTWRVTHRAWYFLCPIWMAEDDTGELSVPIPRWRILWPLWDLSDIIQKLLNWLFYLCGRDELCGFLFRNLRPVKPFDYHT